MKNGILAALLISCGLAGCGSGALNAVVTGGLPTHGRFATSQATGDYAIAQTAGTVNGPTEIQFLIDASPSQQASATWDLTCNENSGGVGEKSGQSTVQAPTVLTLPTPGPSYRCIVSVNSQLSNSGQVVVSLYNGGAPSPSSAAASASATSGATGTIGSSGSTTTAPTPSGCESSHLASYKCATAKAPYCQQGACLYPSPSDGKCAQGYQLEGSPQACYQLPTTTSNGSLSCPLGETVSAETSCGFAAMVMSDYEATPAPTITAVSPVTGKSYTMACAASNGTVTCTGGTGSLVSFRWPSSAPSGSSSSAAGASTFVPTPQEVAEATQALAGCQREQPTLTLAILEKEAATSEGIQC